METRQKWTEQQQQFIRFVGRGQKDTKGNEYTMEEYAQLVGVNRSTLYDWRAIPGFAEEVFNRVMQDNMKHLPALVQAQTIAGLKKGKGGDTSAFLALMRQWSLLKADKTETKLEHSGEVNFNNQVPIQ